MTDEEKQARIAELARTLAYANALGVRAAVCGDEAQRQEAARIYREAKAELEALAGTVVRLRRADDQAWVRMDAEPPAELRQFPADDENGRGNHIMLWPDECERANGIGKGEQA